MADSSDAVREALAVAFADLSAGIESMTLTLTAATATLDHLGQHPDDDEPSEQLTLALSQLALEARVALESALDTQRALSSLVLPPRPPQRRPSEPVNIKAEIQ
jgi:hypothetical protein